MNSPGLSRILRISGVWAIVLVQWKRNISTSEKEKTASLVIFVVYVERWTFYSLWKSRNAIVIVVLEVERVLDMCEREKRGVFIKAGRE